MTDFPDGTRVDVFAPHQRGQGTVQYTSVSGKVRVMLDSGVSKSFQAKHLRPLEHTPPAPGPLSREPWYDSVTGVPVAKSEPWRSPTYLAWVRKQPCQSCGKAAPCEASHHPEEGHGSMGLKCGDDRVMSLCTECHGNHHAGRGKTLDRYWVERVVGRMFRTYVLREMGLGRAS